MGTQTGDVRSGYSLLCQEVNLEWLNTASYQNHTEILVYSF